MAVHSISMQDYASTTMTFLIRVKQHSIENLLKMFIRNTGLKYYHRGRLILSTSCTKEEKYNQWWRRNQYILSETDVKKKHSANSKADVIGF